MAKTKLPYPPQFRRQMVELVRAGRTLKVLAAVFEPTAQSWRMRARGCRGSGCRPGA